MKKLIKSANIATQPSRINVLSKMIDSIYDQFDVIRICLNEFKEMPEFLIRDKIRTVTPVNNLTDNGKFVELDYLIADEYYFTLDDDIVYPPDYVSKTIENINKFGCVISYHGRLLRGLNLNYYSGHEFFSCTWESKRNFELDVCGTGVTAFSTKYFKPTGIATDPRQKMSDLLFSLEVAKAGKTIGYCEKPANWIKPMAVKNTIFDHFSKNKIDVQNKIADEIFRTKYND